MKKHGMLTFLAAALVGLAGPAVQADGLTKVEVAKLGKAATAHLRVTRNGSVDSGSAFCIHSSGLFITSFTLVGDTTDITVVLNVGREDQKILKAKIVRQSRALDLALLQVDGAKDLPVLELNAVDELAEKQEVVACGYPTDQPVVDPKNPYPTLKITTCTIKALPGKEANALTGIHLNLDTQRGNRGGPVLDVNGKVIGVLGGEAEPHGVTFALLASRVAAFVAEPAVQFRPPTLTAANVHSPVLFQVRVTGVVPAAKPYDIELVLSANGVEHKHPLAFADGVYSAKVMPIAATPESKDGPVTCWIIVKRGGTLLRQVGRVLELDKPGDEELL